jgi:hypothetical protein
MRTLHTTHSYRVGWTEELLQTSYGFFVFREAPVPRISLVELPRDIVALARVFQTLSARKGGLIRPVAYRIFSALPDREVVLGASAFTADSYDEIPRAVHFDRYNVHTASL